MQIDWYEIMLYIGLAMVSINLLPLLFTSTKSINIDKMTVFLQTAGSALIFASVFIGKMNIIYIVYPGILCVFGIITSLKLVIHYKQKKKYFPPPPPINPYYHGY